MMKKAKFTRRKGIEKAILLMTMIVMIRYGGVVATDRCPFNQSCSFVCMAPLLPFFARPSQGNQRLKVLSKI